MSLYGITAKKAHRTAMWPTIYSAVRSTEKKQMVNATNTTEMHTLRLHWTLYTHTNHLYTIHRIGLYMLNKHVHIRNITTQQVCKAKPLLWRWIMYVHVHRTYITFVSLSLGYCGMWCASSVVCFVANCTAMPLTVFFHLFSYGIWVWFRLCVKVNFKCFFQRLHKENTKIAAEAAECTQTVSQMG